MTVGVSGTGGGFQKFCTGETDINDASRPIAPTEAGLAARNGIQYIELPVAYDGISVMVNPATEMRATTPFPPGIQSSRKDSRHSTSHSLDALLFSLNTWHTMRSTQHPRN